MEVLFPVALTLKILSLGLVLGGSRWGGPRTLLVVVVLLLVLLLLRLLLLLLLLLLRSPSSPSRTHPSPPPSDPTPQLKGPHNKAWIVSP